MSGMGQLLPLALPRTTVRYSPEAAIHRGPKSFAQRAHLVSCIQDVVTVLVCERLGGEDLRSAKVGDQMRAQSFIRG